MNQKDMILQYLTENEWIEPVTALREVGTMKLATRISELKEAGYNFDDEYVHYTNFRGDAKCYKRYRLAKIA